MKVNFDETIELVGQVVDGVGVLIPLVGAAAALVPYVILLMSRRAGPDDYRQTRRRLGRAILLGLEFLVAADIIRTVVISPTLGSVAALGVIVLIRTFLSAALQVEIEGHWPWQQKPTQAESATKAPA